MLHIASNFNYSLPHNQYATFYLAGVDGVAALLAAAATAFARFLDAFGFAAGTGGPAAGTLCGCSLLTASSHKHSATTQPSL